VEQLILRLGARAEQPVYWGMWDSASSQILASGMLPDAQQLTTLHERAGGRPVRAIVDSSALRLTTVTLPPNAGRKVIASIGFMLEDDIASDVAEHFIALGPRIENEQTVIIVSHEQMQQWQTWLSEAGFVCDTMIPDALALPSSSDTLNMLQLDEQILWRHGQWQGMTGERSWMGMALQGYTQQHPELTGAVALSAELKECLTLPVPITVNEAELELPIHTLALHSDSPECNLLQQTYKVKAQSNSTWLYWRNTAAAVLLAFALSLANKGLQYTDLKAQNDALQASIKTSIAQSFPELGSYRDPRRAITRYVQQRENNSGAVSGIQMLGNLGTAFAAGNIKAQTIRFDHKRGEIRMQAVADNFAQLERFKTKAIESGYSVTQGAINNQNNRVIGALIIKS
jgi:general secretion pathway protein L